MLPLSVIMGCLWFSR